MIEVVAWGIAGSVAGAGHSGSAWLGQSRGGAVDPKSLALANRLVGNPERSAGFESSGGLVLRFDTPTMVALTGAVADVQVSGGPPVGWGSPTVLPAGAQLRIRRLLDGARAYVAVRGGMTGPDGGRATGRHTVGPDPGTAAASEPAARRHPRATIRVWPGPRADWFEPRAWQLLVSQPFLVVSTNRVGTRLAGPALRRNSVLELPSEGLLEGAVQVPPDGQPIIMLADHPTTGGYPVLAVVDPADITHVAQAPVGTTLRFHPAATR